MSEKVEQTFNKGESRQVAAESRVQQLTGLPALPVHCAVPTGISAWPHPRLLLVHGCPPGCRQPAPAGHSCGRRVWLCRHAEVRGPSHCAAARGRLPLSECHPRLPFLLVHEASQAFRVPGLTPQRHSAMRPSLACRGHISTVGPHCPPRPYTRQQPRRIQRLASQSLFDRQACFKGMLSSMPGLF